MTTPPYTPPPTPGYPPQAPPTPGGYPPQAPPAYAPPHAPAPPQYAAPPAAAPVPPPTPGGYPPQAPPAYTPPPTPGGYPPQAPPAYAPPHAPAPGGYPQAGGAPAPTMDANALAAAFAGQVSSAPEPGHRGARITPGQYRVRIDAAEVFDSTNPMNRGVRMFVFEGTVIHSQGTERDHTGAVMDPVQPGTVVSYVRALKTTMAWSDLKAFVAASLGVPAQQVDDNAAAYALANKGAGAAEGYGVQGRMIDIVAVTNWSNDKATGQPKAYVNLRFSTPQG